jgi:hypothetical protein
MAAYSYLAVQHAIAVTRVAGLSASAGRTSPVAIEGTVRPAPDTALPIFGDCLVLGVARRKLESGGIRSVSRLSRDAWPNVVWTVVRDEQRCDV